MEGLYSLVEFDKGDKWFVAAEAEIDSIKYSYLVRVNEEEDDFLDEYQLVKSIMTDDGEYMETVTDKEVEKKILPILIPDSQSIAEGFKNLRKN